jgi:hypothetical protein
MAKDINQKKRQLIANNGAKDYRFLDLIARCLMNFADRIKNLAFGFCFGFWYLTAHCKLPTAS